MGDDKGSDLGDRKRVVVDIGDNLGCIIIIIMIVLFATFAH